MAVEGVEQLDTYFGEYLPALFYALLAPLTLFFILSFIHLPAAILLFLLIPLIPLSIAAVQTWAKKLLSRYWSQYTALGDSFLENLYGLTTLKIYDTDSLRQEKMEREAEHFRRVTMRVLTMQLNSITVMDIIAYGGAAAGAILAVKGIQNAALPFDYALFILLVSAEFFIPMRQLGSFFHIAMNGMAAGDKIFRLLGTKADPRGERVLTKNPRICAENLSFSYERDREILSHISLTALPGSRIAIVGESGSGKSTLAALLAGHLRAGEGQVKIDGIAPEEYAPESLNRQITYIGHQGYVFKGTLRENLQMAKPSATEEEMLFFLSLVRIDKLFEKEEGLDTPLLSQAANLSGGQRQRIVLARALLYDSWVYILDEATSNIDVESEEAILEAVRTLHGKKTVIVISHRLANIADADCIYVMEEGKLAESGTHRDLIAKGGYYCSLWNTQKELEAYRGGTL